MQLSIVLVPDPVGNSDDCVTSEQSEQEDPESKGIKQPKILDLELVKEELTPGQIKVLSRGYIHEPPFHLIQY